MSSLPGLTLESYVMWCYDLTVEEHKDANFSLRVAEMMGNSSSPRPLLTQDEFKSIMSLVESKRDSVEDWLLDFDEENQSWRDYACNVEWWPDDVEKQIWDRIKEIQSSRNPLKEESPPDIV